MGLVGVTRWVTQAGWQDSPHLTPEATEQLARSYLPNERDARMRGIPSLGAGAIYPVPESDIVVDPFLGSGTTLVAAKELHRAGIGVEQDAEYFEIARKALAQDYFDFSK